MTNNDILKALERHMGEAIATGYAKLHHNEISNAISLIDQQQADIDRLKLEWTACSWKKDTRIIVLQNTIAEQKAEIKRQRADKIRLIEHFGEREKEVVKEFVALLKENSGAWGELTIEQIEQLAEEMVGEDE